MLFLFFLFTFCFLPQRGTERDIEASGCSQRDKLALGPSSHTLVIFCSSASLCTMGIITSYRGFAGSSTVRYSVLPRDVANWFFTLFLSPSMGLCFCLISGNCQQDWRNLGMGLANGTQPFLCGAQDTVPSESWTHQVVPLGTGGNVSAWMISSPCNLDFLG